MSPNKVMKAVLDSLESFESAHPTFRGEFAWECEQLRSALAEPKWNALTLDEVLDCAKDFEGHLPEGWMKIVDAVDARLREKNT